MGEAAPAGGAGPAGAAVDIVVRVPLGDVRAADVGVGVHEILLRPPGGALLHAELPPVAVALIDDADAGRAVRPVAFRPRARAGAHPR